jgi:hypothetical protein
MADIEQLTDNERQHIAECSGKPGEMALRIIDRDAATLDRVRALRDTHERQQVGSVFSTALVEYVDDALAGATAAEDPQSAPCPIERCGWRDQCDAANARIVELQDLVDMTQKGKLIAVEHLRSEVTAHRRAHQETSAECDVANARIAELEAGDPCGKCCRERDAANARAEAANRNSLTEAGEVIRLEDALKQREAAYSELEGIRVETARRLARAKSEAEQWKAKCEATERGPTPDWAEVLQAHVDRSLRAEARAEAAARALAIERVNARHWKTNAEEAESEAASLRADLQVTLGDLNRKIGLLGEARARIAELTEALAAAERRMAAESELVQRRERLAKADFVDAWGAKRREGYQYGRDALENVRLGWDMALEALRGQ